MKELTPKEIVDELNKYIVGQDNAKKAVAIALRNRYRRKLLTEDLRDEVIPKNILMIGPTGVGKTEIARRLAQIANAPFIKVEATKFTEVGYVGRDVDSMVRDLVQLAVSMVEAEKIAEVQDKAREQAIERILDVMQPMRKTVSEAAKKHVESAYEIMSQLFGNKTKNEEASQPEEKEDDQFEKDDAERRMRIRDKLRKQLIEGILDDNTIEIELEETGMAMLQIFPPQPGEEMGIDMQSILGPLAPKRTKKRKVTIGEAKELLTREEAQKLVDHDQIVHEAIRQTEESGIIFIDELDKVAGREKEGSGPQVSREGVQRDILPIIEGSTVSTKYGPVRTNHILFIAAGAFHVSKPSDLIPELQGRLPIRVELDSLTAEDFRRILTEPKNALVKQYTALLATEGVQIDFTDDAIIEIAHMAEEVNSQMENIGARRLHTIMERLLEDLSFSAPELYGSTITIDVRYVREKLEGIVKSEDISRYIL